MSTETNNTTPDIAPPKSRGGMFAVSLLYLLIEVGGFWSHGSAWEFALLIGVLCITVFCAFQFGSRTFDPIRAAARTANLSGPTKSRLKQANGILRAAAAIFAIAIVAIHFTVDRHFFRDWIFYFYPTFFFLPLAIDDLIGTPPRLVRPQGLNWNNLKPIRSDQWGERT